ncbi:PEP-CTERM sorting domain-containing protein [Luteolibacter algae]|uniref:PEP-CTERM sorting domain-containing protein n=1 Tax=Luteolibacter algae TaxID=454151 RepID=A0ABW5D5X2_9BACT
MKSKICALCATFVASAGLASAQSFTYNAQDLNHDSVIDPGNLSYKSSIAYIDDFALMYNPGSKSLDVSVTLSKNNHSPDGFWFVLSDGPNPKDDKNQYAIFYFDASKASPIVTAYVYDGKNNGDSWSNPGSLLASSQTGSSLTASASTSGDISTYQFNADVSAINDSSLWPTSYNLGSDWEGAQFGEEVGIWFHTFELAESSKYHKDGSIKKLKIKRDDYFDTNAQKTVPEPSALMLSLLGVGLLARRKR